MSPCSPLSHCPPLKGGDRRTDFGTLCPTTIGTDRDRADRHNSEGTFQGQGPARGNRPFALFILPRLEAKRLTLRQTLLPVKFRACRLLRRVHKYDKTISNYK